MSNAYNIFWEKWGGQNFVFLSYLWAEFDGDSNCVDEVERNGEDRLQKRREEPGRINQAYRKYKNVA